MFLINDRHVTFNRMQRYFFYIYIEAFVPTERNPYRFCDDAITLCYINYLRVTRSLLVKMYSRRS